MMDNEFLSEAEVIVAKRGRNTQNHHIPKHASLEDYSYSTAFEALLGYLYLHKKDDRVKEIIRLTMKSKKLLIMEQGEPLSSEKRTARLGSLIELF